MNKTGSQALINIADPDLISLPDAKNLIEMAYPLWITNRKQLVISLFVVEDKKTVHGV